MLKWQVGDVTVTRIAEWKQLFDVTWFLPDATQDRLDVHRHWLYPDFMDEAGRLRISIHAFVIESQGRRIIVDTCIGNDKERSFPGTGHLATPFLEHLADAGHPRETIDMVLCTHLHLDHVGWNTMMVGGRWVPTFPNARYLIAEREWRFWHERELHGDDAIFDSPAVIGDSVTPVIEAGLVDFVSETHRLTEDVWLEPTPGHTPGHVSVRISSRGQDAIITGDLVHHPLQFAEAGWASSADCDPVAGIETRQAFVERTCGTGVLILGTHFAPPTGGHIVREGAEYRFEGPKDGYPA